MHVHTVSSLGIVSAIVIAMAIGCSSSTSSAPDPVCLDEPLDMECTPAFEPTYDALYTNTFQRSCTLSGVSCHASTGRQGGLDFGDADSGYAGLMNGMVRAGDPQCGSLVHRVFATSGTIRMPPGRALPDGEKCAIVQWIAQGAKR